MTKYLLNHCAALEDSDKHGFGALHWATIEGDKEAISSLLKSGYNVNEKVSNMKYQYELY